MREPSGRRICTHGERRACHAGLEGLEEEREALKKREAQLVELEQSFGEEQDFIRFFANGDTKDIVELDVSGELFGPSPGDLLLCTMGLPCAWVGAEDDRDPSIAVFASPKTAI